MANINGAYDRIIELFAGEFSKLRWMRTVLWRENEYFTYKLRVHMMEYGLTEPPTDLPLSLEEVFVALVDTEQKYHYLRQRIYYQILEWIGNKGNPDWRRETANNIIEYFLNQDADEEE